MALCNWIKGVSCDNLKSAQKRLQQGRKHMSLAMDTFEENGWQYFK